MTHLSPPLLTVRPAPAPPSPSVHRVDVSPGDTNVLSRLSALFNNNNSNNSSHTTADDASSLGLSRAKTSPAGTVLSPQISPATVVDRESIKILMVTWNMGDALPKGDLSVLLGDIPNHVPSSPSPTIPQLPPGNVHPYHIVVIAGQECPTDSGVPRGLGGGIMKGVHNRAAHRREREERKKERDDETGMSFEDSGGVGGSRTPQGETDDDAEEEARGAAASPTPNTPVLHKHHHTPGSKGWSTMLDDWFCGPVTRDDKNVLPAATPSPGGSPILPASSPTPVPPPLNTPLPPGLLRSSSAPGVIPSFTEPLLIPPAHITAGPLSHSPLARSVSSSASESSASSPEENHSYLHPRPPTAPASPGPLRPKAATVGKRERPAIVIPNDEPERTRDGEKCYLHLVKERLMGMYLSVYVYKGCEHLVQGVDKDFVTAGLAGGRLGNKGGIGISLKLAEHRFLFVNSHLAAHTTRVSARLANIAKIKSELRLDCFLPKDDPRASLEDLTDRFDSVFWCGDLNFRLDLSRLHAEWLVEQKKYDEALMWDQLKNVMKDEEKNPFVGFQEGVIDFPPTFKYDVWRSIKSTNRDLRRSLRRRGTLDGKNVRRPTAADLSPRLGANAALSHVPEVDLEDGEDRNSDDDVRTLASRRSFESNGGGYTSAGPSTVGTDVDESEEFATSVDASAYGSRHKALEVALKEKTKRFLGLVKMDKVLSPSPSRRKLARSASKKIKEKPSTEFDYTSRRTSVSSLASLEPATPIIPDAQPRTSLSSNRSMGDGALGPPRRPSDASVLSSSPNQPMRRRFSVLKRTVSSRSSNNDGRSGDSHEVGPDDIDDNIDYREGVYDSSKKQRVPSWCDRVLWKSVIEPEPEIHPPPSPSHEEHHTDRGHRALNRLSHAFANLGGHLKLSMTRTGSIDPQDRANMHFNRSLPPTPPSERHQTEYVASPQSSPPLRPESETPNAHESYTQSPLRQSSYNAMNGGPGKSPVHTRLASRSRAGSASARTHPLLDAEMVGASPPAWPKITFDPALPADADRAVVVSTSTGSMGSVGALGMRPRANSASVPAIGAGVSGEVGNRRGQVGMKRSLSASSSHGIVVPDIPPLGPRQPQISPQPPAQVHSGSRPQSQRQTSGSSISRRTHTLDVDPSQPMTRPLNPQHISTGAVPVVHSHHTEDRNSFVKFIKDLPGWLHVRGGATPAQEVDVAVPATVDGAGKVRRHLRGEVECLHYGTIDDAGMRQLEGRSDHRPAVFAAAVYVGD